jgi:hypothetical protein
MFSKVHKIKERIDECKSNNEEIVLFEEKTFFKVMFESVMLCSFPL